MITSKVSTKGSIVIPLNIRKKYGIEPGMQMSITESNGTIRIVPIPKEPIKALRGCLNSSKTALEMKQEMREEELAFEKKKWNRVAKK